MDVKQSKKKPQNKEKKKDKSKFKKRSAKTKKIEFGVIPLKLDISFDPPVVGSLYDLQKALESIVQCRLFFLELYKKNGKAHAFVHFKDEGVVEKFRGRKWEINLGETKTLLKFINGRSPLLQPWVVSDELLQTNISSLGINLSNKFPCKVVSTLGGEKFKQGQDIIFKIKIISLGTSKTFIKNTRKVYCLAETKFQFDKNKQQEEAELPPNGSFQFQVTIKVPANFNESFLNFAIAFKASERGNFEQFIIGFPKIGIAKVKSAEDIEIKIDDGSNVWDERKRKQILVGQISRVNSTHIHSDFGNF